MDLKDGKFGRDEARECALVRFDLLHALSFFKETMGEGRQRRRHDADKQNGPCCASPSDA